jgi:hypothetical protein
MTGIMFSDGMWWLFLPLVLLVGIPLFFLIAEGEIEARFKAKRGDGQDDGGHDRT